MPWKPDRYPDLAPYLLVAAAEAMQAFFEATFNATRLRVISNETGGIMHAECRIGDSVVIMTGRSQTGRRSSRR